MSVIVMVELYRASERYVDDSQPHARKLAATDSLSVALHNHRAELSAVSTGSERRHVRFMA